MKQFDISFDKQKLILFTILIVCVSCQNPNLAPTADFTVSPHTGNTETLFTLDASLSFDPEGEELQYKWEWGYDGQGETNYRKSSSEVHVFTTPGLRKIGLEVKDPNGSIHKTTREIMITQANRPPSSPSVPTPANRAPNVLLRPQLGWECNDPDGDKLEYDLYFGTNSEPDLYRSALSSRVIELPELESLTSYYWQIAAKDPHGAKSFSPVWEFKTRKSNEAPGVPHSPKPANSKTDVPIEVELQWECSDPENDRLTFKLYFGNSSSPSLLAEDLPEASYTASSLEYSERYYWKVEAEDDQGNTQMGPLWSFTTAQNEPPNADFTIAPESGDTTTLFEFDASSSTDKETATKDLLCMWDWESDGTWDTGYSANKTRNHQFAQPGEYKVTLRVSDEHGEISSKMRIVVVSESNTAPSAIFTVEPSSGTVETKFEFDASGCSDSETASRDLMIRWDWESDDVWDTGYSRNKKKSYQFAKPGEYAVLLQVEDEHKLTAKFVQTIVVEAANTPPLASFSAVPHPTAGAKQSRGQAPH